MQSAGSTPASVENKQLGGDKLGENETSYEEMTHRFERFRHGGASWARSRGRRS